MMSPSGLNPSNCQLTVTFTLSARKLGLYYIQKNSVKCDLGFCVHFAFILKTLSWRDIERERQTYLVEDYW